MLTKCLTTIPEGSRPQAFGGRNAKRLVNESVIWSVLHGDMQQRKRAMSSDHGRTRKVLGVPFNVAQYSLLTHMVAHQLDCEAKEFVWVGADVHVYENHVEQVRKQLANKVLPMPWIGFSRKPSDVFSYKLDDFVIGEYRHAEYIQGTVSLQGTPGLGAAI